MSPWTGRVCSVHRGPTSVQTEGTAAHSPELGLGRSGAPKLVGGGATERGEHGKLGGWLTEARAAVWRSGNGGAEPRAAALGGSSARARGEEKRGAC
jgi:hypothetical protein